MLTPVCDASVGGRLFEWFQSYEYIRNFLSRFAWERANGLLLISGAFAGFRRAAVIAVGGFDRDCLVEDYELIHRLRRHGVRAGHAWTTAVVGGARARTAAPADLPAFLAQRRRWFGGFLQTQYWYRDMVGDRRYGHLGTWMLPVKAFDTLQPVFGLTAFFLLVWYLALGRVHVLLPVAIVIGVQDRHRPRLPSVVAAPVPDVGGRAADGPRRRRPRLASSSRSASSCCGIPGPRSAG